MTTASQLATLVDSIWRSGVCVSPVIETVGSGYAPVPPPEAVVAHLEPVLSKIGMLTLQAAFTGARSNQGVGSSGYAHVDAYIQRLRPIFHGTFQIQGGITTRTIGAAVRTGAEFLVAGTELFHHPHGHAPYEAIKDILQAAACVL